MNNSHSYSFTTFNTSLGEAGFRPYLPITLTHCGQELQDTGLLDTGATATQKAIAFSLAQLKEISIVYNMAVDFHCSQKLG